MSIYKQLEVFWLELYNKNKVELLEGFVAELEDVKSTMLLPAHTPEWYKNAVIYSLYVDLFNKDFCGLIKKLDYLEELGVNCIWLLPILDSPMKDAGFDIRDYRSIREDLLVCGSDHAGQQLFDEFLHEAHSRDIKVIFDIAINHTSEEHPWFIESQKSEGNPFRDYYIWSKDTTLYKDARIIFKGLCESNWEKRGDSNFFHRFFEFQPDLNYKNPAVLLEMCRNFLFWLKKGVDGFRADAIPYLWKEEDTTCENLPKIHIVVKFFRAVLDFVRPDTLLLAEACQKPVEVVKYFGEGDECNAGYHFPLMPQIFKALKSKSLKPVKNVLSTKDTPDIPVNAQWLTFLRCHDELSLELVYVTEEDRKFIHESYCKKPEWDFRLGQGVSARLSELLDCDPERIALAFSVMLTLPGTPIVYYGDEFGKLNDGEYYKEMIKLTGKDDTRFLVRGKIDWETVKVDMDDTDSYSGKIFKAVSEMIHQRNNFECFGKGSMKWITVRNLRGITTGSVGAYIRKYGEEQVLVIQNLSDTEESVYFDGSEDLPLKDIFGNNLFRCETWEYLKIPAYSYFWVKQD
ncbi:MAG: hypothetical protein K8R53_01875 [Bacteroidales bacterium]|nr:hypothetical protein [Bacteroidales bacterium]